MPEEDATHETAASRSRLGESRREARDATRAWRRPIPSLLGEGTHAAAWRWLPALSLLGVVIPVMSCGDDGAQSVRSVQCRVSLGSEIKTVQLSLATEPASASVSVGDYNVVVSAISNADAGKILRIDVNGPAPQPTTSTNSLLPAGVIHRSEGTISHNEPVLLGAQTAVQGGPLAASCASES